MSRFLLLFELGHFKFCSRYYCRVVLVRVQIWSNSCILVFTDGRALRVRGLHSTITTIISTGDVDR